MGQYISSHTGQQIDNAVDSVLNGKLQKKLIQGNGIKIEGNVISNDFDHSRFATQDGVNQALSQYAKKNDVSSTYATIASVEHGLSAKQNKITDLESIREGASKGSTALQKHQDISHLATKSELSNGLAEKQNTIADLASIRSGANLGSTALQEHQDISHLLPKIDFTTYETKTDSQIKELSDRVDELDRGEVFIMDNTLVFRNYADAKIEGETLKF